MTDVSACAGCVKAESQIRFLLSIISNGLLDNPSKLFGVAESEPVDSAELFGHWMKEIESDPKFPLCPHVKKRIESLVFQLLNEGVSSRKRKAPPETDEGLAEMLASLRRLAVDPVAGAHRHWRRMVLNTRKAMFLGAADVADMQQFPYPVIFKKNQEFLRF